MRAGSPVRISALALALVAGCVQPGVVDDGRPPAGGSGGAGRGTGGSPGGSGGQTISKPSENGTGGASAPGPDAATPPSDPPPPPPGPDAAPATDIGASDAMTDRPAAPPSTDAAPVDPGRRFSFFVTSIEAIRELSGSQNGFGGNYGGLEGADSICQRTAAKVGFGHKTWRAFLSATKGADGQPVHAIDRIGSGPWFDRNQRMVASGPGGLLGARPDGDPQAIVDLANERGVPQKQYGDNHDVVTGSNRMGRLANSNPASTCNDWTSASATGGGRPMCGHSWSRVGRQQWIEEHTVPGCAPGVNLRDNTVMSGNCIGCNGGYGAIYCFALTP